jgi:polyvinyl alcohol dehydrogenase (cytochrome)
MLACLLAPAAAAGAAPYDWPTYGHDPHHDFVGATTLDATSARMLVRAWLFPTGDAVTANPVVAGASVYVGSWDGSFYAIDRATGALRWKFAIKPQPAVSPQPGSQPRDITSDGGLITSSAWYEPAGGGRPALVIFGGGYTLYALRADNGSVYWEHDYTGRPEAPPDPAHDETRIFSSPAVVGDEVLFGVSADGEPGHRGYVAAADLATGVPRWTFQTDVDTSGKVLDDGCGGVWSSPTIDEARGLAIVDVADCRWQGIAPYNERVLALHITDGSLAWVFTPPRLRTGDPPCDWDFGATANLGSPDAAGAPSFLGVGGKDGTYYRLDPASGALRWATNVVFGGFSGGFIATTAYDGRRAYGATALGDFGRFESNGLVGCEPGNPADLPFQEPSLHAFDGGGAVAWQEEQSQSFGPTTVAGGMVFVGTGLTRQVQIRSADSGQLLNALALPAPSDSGIVVAGNALLFGVGSSEQGSPAGVYAYTPLGVAPTG